MSDLRRLLGAEAIETSAPGYVLRVDPDRLDLGRFERLTQDAAQALERNERQVRSTSYAVRSSCGVARRSPTSTYESFAQPAIARLEELRLAATEQRLDAELELGRHTRVLAEIETLVLDHPLRERPRALLMLALYRAGRQAEALDVYRMTRDSLVGEYGIEPSAALRELERRILVQDSALDLLPATPSTATAEAERTLLVVALDEERTDALLSVAAPLAALPGRALIFARLLKDEREVSGAAEAVNARRAALGDSVRSAAFTSREPARDVVRLATNYDVELVLLDGPGESSARYAFGCAELAGRPGLLLRCRSRVDTRCWHFRGVWWRGERLGGARTGCLARLGCASPSEARRHGRRSEPRPARREPAARRRIARRSARRRGRRRAAARRAKTRSVARRPRAGDVSCHRDAGALAGGKRRQTNLGTPGWAAVVVRASRYSAERSCAA